MSFTATQALNDAMLVGGIAAALEADPVNPAYAIVFAGANALVTMVFTRPSTTLTAHALVFSQASASGDLITTQGSADNFKLYNGVGTLLGSGDVTPLVMSDGSAGTGALQISGTTGTLLYAGARAILGSLKIG